VKGPVGSDRYTKHFDKARREIVRINRKAYGKKKQVIIHLAENLTADGMPCHMICSESVKQLYGVVTPTFVRRCLAPKYKDCRQSENAKKQAGHRKKNAEMIFVYKEKRRPVILLDQTLPSRLAFPFSPVPEL